MCPQFKFKQEQPFVQTELAAAQQKASHRHPRSPSELKPELFRLTCVFRLLQNSPKPTGVHSSQQKTLTTRLAKDYLLLLEGKLCSLHAVFLTLIVKSLFLVEKVKFCHFFGASVMRATGNPTAWECYGKLPSPSCSLEAAPVGSLLQSLPQFIRCSPTLSCNV